MALFRTGPYASHAEVADISADDHTFPFLTRSVIVETAGDLKVKMHAGDEVTIPAPAGVLPIRVVKIIRTGTTASGITGLF